jgi:hypothetical protein
MRSAGIMARLRDHYWYKPLKKTSEPDFEVSLNAVIPIFMVLALGAGFSMFLLAMELVIHKIFHRQ